MMIPIITNLIVSAVILVVWTKNGNPFTLWLSGVCFGVALTAAVLEIAANFNKRRRNQ